MAADASNNDRNGSYADLTAGAKVKHYKIISRLGAGGMGEVYLAEDTKLGREVALKFLKLHLSDDDNFRARFKREAQAAAKLSHSNIITVHEVNEFNERPYIVMEYCPGKSLADIVQSNSLGTAKVLDIAIQICNGLNEAHKSGVTHRDLKPSNIMFDKTGRVKILDFGIAALKGSDRITEKESPLGTIGYIAPEIIKGEKVDHRSDIFSLGVILYEMIEGQAPFESDYKAAILYSILNEEPKPISVRKDVDSENIQYILNRALSKDLSRRYQNIKDFGNDLIRERQNIDSGKVEFINSPYKKISVLFHEFSLNMKLILSFLLFILLIFYIISGHNQLMQFVRSDHMLKGKHLAVLPFTNLGATEADQIFIDGLMETITSKLTQLEQFHGSMWVVPASVIREKEVFNIGQARKKFGVTLAITGSVQSFNDDRRLTLNLVDTKSERQISSAVIDNIFTDVSALQDSTVLELARMLEIHLQPKDQKFLVAGGTFNLDAYHFYVKGRGYLQYHEKMENIDSALVSFQKALNEDQHFALAYAGLGEAYWRKYAVLADTNLEKLAIYNSQRALDENNTLAPVYVTLGLILKGAGRYEEALEEFRVALRLDSVNYDASCGMAKTYKALNMIILAESTYIDAIHAKPDYWAGYYNLGLFYLESGRHEDALNQLKIAERLDHDGYDAWNNIGVLFYGLGRSQDALLMWNRSIAIEPNYGAYSNLGSLFYIQRRYAEAADAFKKALSLDSNDYRVWINYASVLDKLVGEENRAIITYRKAANMAEIQRNINPRNVEVLSNLATCYSFLGEKSKAQLLIDQALSISPKDLEVLVTAASIYDNMGERSIAVSYIAKAINGGYPLTQLKTYQDLTELLKDPGLDSMLTGI